MPRTSEARDHRFDTLLRKAGVPGECLGFEDLKKVRLAVSADLGGASMLVREVLALKLGSVVTLDKLAGEMTDIYVNDVPLARGEVVVIGDALHVRINEIVGAAEEQNGAQNAT